jgi:hypothetical protein
MSAGMMWVDVKQLKLRFRFPLLIEVPGDRSDLASESCEIVDVQNEGQGAFTILHVPHGSLPCETKRAMPVTYEDATVASA